MKEFMDQDFLLESETAKHLYHDYAANLPIVDYHCHISPREIYEDRRFDDLAQVWLGGKQPDGSYFGDHYKWRVMRSNGVSEDYVSGEQDNYQRFLKFVEALELAVGNPMYHWCNLELRRFFGYEGHLSLDTAKRSGICVAISSATTRILPSAASSRRRMSPSSARPTTRWIPLNGMKKIAADPTIEVKVCPSFRPDKAINIQKPGCGVFEGAGRKRPGKERLASVESAPPWWSVWSSS